MPDTLRTLFYIILVVLILGACTGSTDTAVESTASTGSSSANTMGTDQEDAHENEEAVLPTLTPVSLAQGERLQVVATTNIVADVVGRVGGEAVDLYSMLPAGADPHSYQPTPEDLRAISDAHIVFVNGLGLEEPLGSVLDDAQSKVVSVNAGVETMVFDEEARQEDGQEDGEDHGEEHEHDGLDPHTWFDVENVMVWADTVARSLIQVDPDREEAYRSGAAAYQEELVELDTEIEEMVADLPPERRVLVTDHGALGYLADTYGFELAGSVIPSFSTMSEPSAQQLAALQDQVTELGVPAIFVSTTVNQQLARRLAQDVGVEVVPIYTGSLSEEDGPVSSYVDLMRYDVRAIVEALR